MIFAEKLVMGFRVMKHSITHNLLISSIDQESKRQEFFSYLEKENLKPFSDANEAYDYIVIEAIKSPLSIYDIYYQHNGKLVIFDTPKLFSRKQYLDVAEGGFCSSLDSGSKWPVRYDGKKEFTFKGHVIILTDLSKEQILDQKKKFEYLIRDMQIL